jgi:hypothetical protein
MDYSTKTPDSEEPKRTKTKQVNGSLRFVVEPPDDRLSRPCGGVGGFDDYVERIEE